MIPTPADQPTNDSTTPPPPPRTPRAGRPVRLPRPARRAGPLRRRPLAGRTAQRVRHGRRLRHALAPGRRQRLRLRQRARHVLRRTGRHGTVVHQHLPARPAGVRLGDRHPPDLRRLRVRRTQRLPGPVHGRQLLRQAVEVHQRARRRRPRRAGRLLGRPVGQGPGQGGEVAGTVAKAAKMGDYLRYSLFDKYFKKAGNCSRPGHLPRRHRQGQRPLPDVLVLRLGRRHRHQRRPGLAHRLQPRPQRLPEPAGRLRAQLVRTPEA